MLLIFLGSSVTAQKKTDANIFGHVISNGEHLPYVSIAIKGTAMGTATDKTGHYRLLNAPVGYITIVASFVGYKTQEINLMTETNKTIEINFDLKEDALRLDEVVVSGNKDAEKRKESAIIVNSIGAKLFQSTHSVTLSEGLNFCSGLRMETNCQSCGFSQVRLNGMEGPYSQILINGRPIFSGLAGVYGLELIPANMIEKVEVVRGGGSALYGGNAIAGTINLRLKNPISNTYEFGVDQSLIGFNISENSKPSSDKSLNFNTSLVSDDHKTGMAVYGFNRNRNAFDANGDDFSEIPLLKNTTAGARIYHRLGYKTKLTADIFHVNEYRRGGNKFDYPEHEADIAESLQHYITSSALTFEHFISNESIISAYFASQKVDRESYYGANRSLKDYGRTKDLTYNTGLQYKIAVLQGSLTTGFDQSGSKLTDMKSGYPDFGNAVIVDDSIVSIPHTENTINANQEIKTTGLFAQYDFRWSRVKWSLGGRYDHYDIKNFQNMDGNIKGNVISPRVSLLYDISSLLQGRLSFSQGYRAPQIFDEDLHNEASGSRKVIHVNDPDLKQESGNSLMASVDFNNKKGNLNLLVEAFYTTLNDPFVSRFDVSEDGSLMVYTRSNANGYAYVRGFNFEMNMFPSRTISTSAGFTLQTSQYSIPQDFNEKRFLRTPESHGFFTFDWNLSKTIAFNASGKYTGKMLVPYFGLKISNPSEGIIRESDPFFDLGIKLQYSIKLNGSKLQLFVGMKNIFNAYQKDFDSGLFRDPGYIYGPGSPRTVYAGLRLGNAF